MADLLGSILSSMDKPPAVGNEQKRMIKKRQEEIDKRHLQEKENLKKFREKILQRINDFIQDPTKHNCSLEPMNKVCRSIVHDVADVAGLTAFSFGDEDVDRYVMIFKKEFAPSDDELLAYRRGEAWDPEKAKEVAERKELARQSEDEEARRKPTKMIPVGNYQDKYEKLIGKESAKDAAKVTKPNKQFGYVPSENKRDQRSIEQALADIRAKKKQKLEEVEPADDDSDEH